MTKFELQNRTKKFHIEVIKLCEYFPKNAAGFEIAKQLIRSAGSAGANYRAACRGKSKTDFIYKIEVVLEKADESLYWLEISKETGLIKISSIDELIKEANELVSIFNAADMTAKRNRNEEIPKSINLKIRNNNVSPKTKPNSQS
jgi:four helix bundle protein